MARNTISSEQIVTYSNSALGAALNILMIVMLSCVALLLSLVGMVTWALAIPILMLIRSRIGDDEQSQQKSGFRQKGEQGFFQIFVFEQNV